jgi:hypothetical protein
LGRTQQEYADNKKKNAGKKADVEDKVSHEASPTMHGISKPARMAVEYARDL